MYTNAHTFGWFQARRERVAYARALAGALDLPIDLLSVVERMDFSRQLACETMTCEEIEKGMDELARQYAKRTIRRSKKNLRN